MLLLLLFGLLHLLSETVFCSFIWWMGNRSACISSYMRYILQCSHLYSEYLFILVQNNSVKRLPGSAFNASVIQCAESVSTEQLSSVCMHEEREGYTNTQAEALMMMPVQFRPVLGLLVFRRILLSLTQMRHRAQIRKENPTSKTTNFQCLSWILNEHTKQFVQDFYLHPTNRVAYAKPTVTHCHFPRG